jgi:hypothetical protein
MITKFGSFIRKTVHEETHKKYQLKPLAVEQKQLFLDALKHKAQKHGSTIDPKLETVILGADFNPDYYTVTYSKQANAFSLQPRAQQLNSPAQQATLFTDAESQALHDAYPGLFTARFAWRQLDDASKASLQQQPIRQEKLPALIPEFDHHPLIIAGRATADRYRALALFEQGCNDYIKVGDYLAILKCCQLIVNYSRHLNNQKLTLKYLDLMQRTLGLATLMLNSHIDPIIAIFKQVIADLKTAQWQEQHEFITVMETAVLLREYTLQMRKFTEVDLEQLATMLNFVQITTDKITHEHTLSLTSKNYFCLAMLLNLEEYILAAIPPLADKLNVAATYSNKIVLNKQDYAVLALAKQHASTAANVGKTPTQSLKQALAQAKSFFDKASKTHSLANGDVDLIACLEQFKSSQYYNQSPQFRDVLQVINDANFINEDKDKERKDLLYKQVVGLMTQLLTAVLTPEHAQIFDNDHFQMGTIYSLGNTVIFNLITLLKYDRVKQIAKDFLTSNQFKEAITTLMQPIKSSARMAHLAELFSLYSAQADKE